MNKISIQDYNDRVDLDLLKRSQAEYASGQWKPLESVIACLRNTDAEEKSPVEQFDGAYPES